MSKREDAIKILNAILSKENVTVGATVGRGISITIKPAGELKEELRNQISLKGLLQEIESELE